MGLVNTRNELDPRTMENSWKLPVLSSITTPPVSPVNGARYRIIATATGVWVGHTNQIAIWDFDNQTWIYETYGEGSILYDLGANDYRYVLNDGTWQQFDKIPLAISDVTGLQNALNLKASTTHQATHVEGGSDEITGQLNAMALVRVTKNGADEIVNKILNLIEGTNISLTVAESGDEIDITINSISSTLNEFAQNLFKILGQADATKKVLFDVDTLVPHLTTVTVKIPVGGGSMAVLEGNQVFTALVQALTMVATNSMTTAKVVLTNTGADPLVNGEIQMNGTTPKIMSDGVVKKLGRLESTDNLTIENTTMTIAQWLLL